MYAAAISEHPVPAFATGEVIGQVLEAAGDAPDLAVVFVTSSHAGALEDVAAVVDEVLGPTVLIGCAAEAVVGRAREVEQGPGVSLWAAWCGPVAPVRLEVEPLGEGRAAVKGFPADPGFDPQAMLLLADPFSFHVEGFLAQLETHLPAMPVFGGHASGARGPGANRLALDGRTHTGGAVGVLFGPGPKIESVVSQGCRPVGDPFVVTRAERNVILELGGRPPMERLMAIATRLTPEDVALVNRGGLHVGIVIDELRHTYGPGDFLVRNVVGVDRDNGAMHVGDEVKVGSVVQFHLRDAIAADLDLDAMLAGRSGEAALVFTCNGRGRRLFGEEDHDARAVADALGDPPVAGFFAQGEFGPVGGHNFVHGFTASIALFSGGV